MSTTLTIRTNGLAGGTSPGASVLVSLNNCSNPRVVGTGQLVPLNYQVAPVNGVVTLILFDNTQITCGVVNVSPKCGCSDSLRTSYYSFSFIYQGVVTSIGSYHLKPGSYNLWDLTPCIGSDCICGNEPVNIPFVDETPLGVIDGVNRVYTLTFKPTNLWLTLGGVYMTEGLDYNIVDNVITFTFAPFAGPMNAKYTYGCNAPTFYEESPTPAPDGVTVNFTLTHPPDPNSLFLYLDGIYQVINVDYSLNGNVITMTTAPAAGRKLYAEYTFGNSYAISGITTEVPVGTIDGVNQDFTISVSNARFLMVQQNQGLLQQGIGYTYIGNTIHFTTAPFIGDVLLATIFS